MNSRTLLALLLLTACAPGQFGIIVTPPPPAEPEPIVPEPFQGTEPPALVETEMEGLLAAPSVHRTLYFHESSELWYRYAYHRWYQAFRWNGHWFLPERTPDALLERTPEAPRKLPTLPEYERQVEPYEDPDEQERPASELEPR